MKFRLRTFARVYSAWCSRRPAPQADAQQDQGACMMDAQVYCGQFIPDRVRVAHCLMSNRSKITPACREAISAFNMSVAPNAPPCRRASEVRLIVASGA